ncbi:MAG: alpha/beta fold hydrolase, partial [Methanomicrobium sp.]|nr:alpha/beta fold hydrolase [Methanomicrobium sp.]
MNFCKFGACILEFFVILVMVCFSVFLLSSQSAVRYDRSKVDIVSEDEDFLEGYIKTTNGNIYFKITGRNKTKTPLILIHGGPGACHDYFEPLSILSDERPVIFYDQLGCGNSDKPEDISIYTVENYVTELSEVRDALGLLEVHILGQSWGGGLLAVYASSEKATGIKSAVFSSPLIDSERWIFDQKSYLSMMPEEIQKSVSLA